MGAISSAVAAPAACDKYKVSTDIREHSEQGEKSGNINKFGEKNEKERKKSKKNLTKAKKQDIL